MTPTPTVRSASYAGVLAILAIVFVAHASTVSAMAELWQRPTYSHGYAVVPVFAWLLWERRATLAALPVRPSWLGLAALVALGALWLAADLVATAAPAQFAVVAMVPAAVAALLGTAWLRALAFPLAFLFFAVPFGEAWVPTMMTWTADFTVMALRASGVPVFREGTHFAIPSGNWSVVEACSGIAYMSSCFMVATLFAWIMYRSTTRRVVFIAGALVVALVANWLRAYAIVMLAHFSDYRLAVGVDHFVYGFVFFGVIMAIVFTLGMMWREDRPAARDAPPAPSAAATSAAVPKRIAAAVAAVAALLWPLASSSLAHTSHEAASIRADIAPRAGWTRTGDAALPWRPQLRNPSWTTVQTYTKDGRQVSLHLAAFDRATPDSKLVSSAHRLVAADDATWKQVDAGTVTLQHGGDSIALATGTLTGPPGRVVVWHGYWVDGTLTASALRAIAAQFEARVRGRSAASAWVALVAVDGEGAASAPSVLKSFLTDMHDAIDDGLQASAGVRTSRPAP